MAAKRAFPKAKSANVFDQARKQPKMFRAGLYARVSTNDQQTTPLNLRSLREYAACLPNLITLRPLCRRLLASRPVPQSGA